MKFSCKNKFLEQILNKKNIPEQVMFSGEKCITNLEVLDFFLKTAPKSELHAFQVMLASNKYSTKSINDFIHFIAPKYLEILKNLK